MATKKKKAPTYAGFGFAGLKEAIAAKPYFTPFQAPTSAPAGSYDPAYDAQLDNANVGFGYAAQDYDTSKTRLGVDYDEGKKLAATDHGYSLADLLTSRNRAGEDYATTTQGIQRDYTNLGTAQAGQARAAGVASGGALAQALAKRNANQGLAQAGVDRSRDRFNEDNATGVARENDRYGRQSAQMDTSFFRGNADLDTGYQRAGAENDRFGRQVNTQTLYAAGAAGALPTRPANESTNSKTGETYRTETFNGTVYHVYPTGRMVPIRKAK